MCGICGYVHLDRTKAPSEDILKAMMGPLSSRGPDEEGYLIKDNAGLGHKRLSIIDLKTGRQPISNEDGSINVICNGEIYNFRELKEGLVKRGHVFRTSSDTEIIAHAYEEYGADCPKYFNGMFAFAVWDSPKRELFIAKDRFGKKPLYYAVFGNQFIFASELKSILKHPASKREIDRQALEKYLAYEYVPSPHSIFRDIYKLESASSLLLKGGGYRIRTYWELGLESMENPDLKDVKSRLKELFKESVRKRLVSDVPLGVFLSGGIDSSAVVAMMAQLMEPRRIKTFSIGFKEKDFDESSDARRVAEYFGTDHREEILEPKTMLEALPAILDILDEPFADSSIIPTYLISKFTRQHVKVALGGDGGDELFYGYPSYKAHLIDENTGFLPPSFKAAPLKVLAGVIPAREDYIARFAKGLDYPKEMRHQVWTGAFTPEDEDKLFVSTSGNNRHKAFILYEKTRSLFDKARPLDRLARIMYVYINTYLTDDILVKVDRASMANSLEVRAPFLDVELAEYAVRIPSRFKLKGFKSKWILREILKESLPPETLAKPKHGFAVPVNKWLREDLKGLLERAFNERKIKKEGIFNYTYVKNLTDGFLKGRIELGRKIWPLFMFEMWYDKWM